MINYGKQYIDEEDIKELTEVLRSDFLTTGPKVNEFEQKFANYVGSKYVVAVSNGTAALHLACLAAGLKKDEELVTSPMTFAASANCALYCGAKPIFVDINEDGLIDEDKIEEKITPKTKIIIPIHFTGLPCNMGEIKEIANKHNLIIIEDACHALGSKYKQSKIGDCQFSDMAIFSFHPVKHITTGEGGIITTNSKEFYEKLLMLRNHGLTKDPEKLLNNDEGKWHQEMQHLGYNYRLTDFQCALGISQLDKINKFIERRRAIAKIYDENFRHNKDIEILKEHDDKLNAYHLYTIKVKDKETRLKLFNFLKQNEISCQVHYIPVYLHPYYKSLGYNKGLCPKAEDLYNRSISVPIYPTLSESDQLKVIEKINYFFKREKMEDTDQLKFWKGKFGEEYIDRNALTKENIDNAEKVFKKIIGNLNLNSILEVGSNIGINLQGIRQALGNNVKLYAVEPNEIAFEKLQNNPGINLEKGFNCNGFKIPLPDNSIDLVFTNGVLIHIAPEDLKQVMSEIVRVSKKYVLCSEYFSHENVTVTYRNNNNVLFKRDFGKYYLECFPILNAKSYGFLWQEEFKNFDNLNWWLFEKKNNNPVQESKEEKLVLPE